MTVRRIFIVLFIFNISPAFCQINIDYWINRGKTKLFNKEYLSAIEDFNTILLYKPDSDEAIFFRGLSKFYLSDYRGSKDDYSMAITIHPYVSKYYFYYFLYRGRVKEKLNDFKGAMDDYNSAIDAWPYNSEEYITRGIMFIKLRKYDDAINDFNKAIELEKNNSYAFVYRGLAKQFKKLYGEAMTDYSKAIQLDRQNVEAYVRRGINHHLLKGFEKALEDFNHAIQLDSMSTFAYFNRANTKIALEDFAGALKDYDKVINLDPENDLTYFNRADLKARKEDYSGAINDYTKTIQINPNNVLSYFNRAIIWQKTGAFRKAIDDYTSVIKLNPLFANAYSNRSTVRKIIKDEAGAMADFNTAINLNANLPKLIEKGIIDSVSFTKMSEFKTMFEENPAKGMQNSDQDISLFPNFAITYGLIDSSQISKTPQDKRIFELNNHSVIHGNYLFTLTNDTLSNDSAEYLLSNLTTITVSEDHLFPVFARAILKKKLQNYNGAIDDYTDILRLKSTFSLAYFNRANTRFDMITYLNSLNNFNDNMVYHVPSSSISQAIEPQKNIKQNYDEVVSDYNMCIQLDPKFSYAYFNLALVEIESKDYSKAITSYGKAIENSAQFGEAFYNRGLTYIYIMQTDEGCRDLSKAGELGIKKAYVAIKKLCDK